MPYQYISTHYGDEIVLRSCRHQNEKWCTDKMTYSYQIHAQGPCAIWDICPKCISNSNLAKSRLPITHASVERSLWNFVQSTAVSLPCSEQNFKLIEQLKRMLWKNEILQDLSSRWLSDVYPILHSTPVFYWEFIFAMLTMFIRYFVIAITSINLSNFTSKISCQNPKLRILPLHGWLVACYQTF